MGKLKLILAIVAAIYLLSNNTATALKLDLCSAKLPTGRLIISSVYDGDDTIYLFGGDGPDGPLSETLKYSVSEDKIEAAGELPIPSSPGAAVMNKFQNIFYFKGWEDPDIFQYFPATQSFANVSRFEDSSVGFRLVKPDADTAIIFGWGDSREELFVTDLNLNTLESKKIGGYAADSTFMDAVWFEEYDAYIFTRDDILKYYRTDNEFASLGRSLPFPYSFSAVSDGRYAYLFGGEMIDRNGSGITVFDPNYGEMEFVEVEGLDDNLMQTALVYVEKLNRIYMFGGVDSRDFLFDQIYYISLEPMNEAPTTTESAPPISTMDPDIFNCMGRPDAVYPYPGDCAKFVICREGHGYPFHCPEHLLFHPINRQCTWPDWVDCGAVPQQL